MDNNRDVDFELLLQLLSYDAMLNVIIYLSGRTVSGYAYDVFYFTFQKPVLVLNRAKAGTQRPSAFFCRVLQLLLALPFFIKTGIILCLHG